MRAFDVCLQRFVWVYICLVSKALWATTKWVKKLSIPWCETSVLHYWVSHCSDDTIPQIGTSNEETVSSHSLHSWACARAPHCLSPLQQIWSSYRWWRWAHSPSRDTCFHGCFPSCWITGKSLLKKAACWNRWYLASNSRQLHGHVLVQVAAALITTVGSGKSR